MGFLDRFRRPARETRQRATGFTDLLIAGLLSRASGEASNDPGSTAAVEIAAGVWSRAMAGAEVRGDRRVMQAVTPRFLSLCARNWIRRGEDIHVIDVRDDRVQLLPAGSWDVNGGPDPDSWWYRLELYSPGKIENAVLPRAGVVHSVWAVASEEPYRGQAPWEFANLSASVLSNLERRLAEEAGGPVGHLLPIPADGGDGEADDPLTGLKASLGDLSGELAVVETTSAGWGEGRTEAPRQDWQPRRIGADPPDVLRNLRGDAETSILAACGIPAGLVLDRDGTASREALRRFYTTTVEPKAGELAAELSRALETPVSFSFRSSWAHDLVGRTNALKGMVEAGIPLADALRRSGLEDV